LRCFTPGVDHHLDGVLLLLVEHRRLRQGELLPVDPDAGVAPVASL
jgi:hypothetical protein